MKSESLHTTDVLVIGGGLAGERCAMEAAAAGLRTTILSLVPPRRSHSCAAQGGMQAALGNCVKGAGDNPDGRHPWGAMSVADKMDALMGLIREHVPRALQEMVAAR